MFDSELRRLADAGSAEHQWQLCLEYQKKRQKGRASRYFRKALEQGHPEAVHQQLEDWTCKTGEYAYFAAALELLDSHPQIKGMEVWRWRLQLTAGLLSPAQEALATWDLLNVNYTPALRYAAMRCAVAGFEAQSLGLLRRASELGDTLAQRVLDADLPGVAPVSSAATAAGQDLSVQQLQAVCEAVKPQLKDQLATDPDVYVCRAWLPELACRLLSVLAEPELKPSLTYEPATGRQIQSPLRTSYSMTFMPWLVDPSVAFVQHRLAAFCGMHPYQCEVLGLLRYQPGQAYQLHYDAFAEDQANVDVVMQDGGQRVRTALIYLNEEYAGGETRMENLDIDVKGSTGDLLVFDNVDERGLRHSDSLHMGMPVESGTKWLLSQWYREHETAFTHQMGWRETERR